MPLSRLSPVAAPSRLGPSRFLPRRRRVNRFHVESDEASVRGRIRDSVPSAPGVYAMQDGAGEIIYVGMSVSLRSRLVSYFGAAAKKQKAGRIAEQAQTLLWQETGHELTALLRELELIRRHQPKLNVRGQPGRRQCGYVFVSAGEAPQLKLAAMPGREARRVWGPIPNTRKYRQAVETLNQLYRLRDCPSQVVMHFSEDLSLFDLDLWAKCLRGGTETCLAPCAAGCSRQEYMASVEAMARCLDGKQRKLLDDLKNQMRRAANAQSYERAARLRDTMAALMPLIRVLQGLRKIRQDCWFVLPTQTARKRIVWHLLAGGQIVHTIHRPGSQSGREECIQLLSGLMDQRDRACDRLPEGVPPSISAEDDFETMHIVRRWFQQEPARVEAALTYEAALDWCAKRSDQSCRSHTRRCSPKRKRRKTSTG